MGKESQEEKAYAQLIAAISSAELRQYVKLLASSYWIARHDIVGPLSRAIPGYYVRILNDKIDKVTATLDISRDKDVIDQLRDIKFVAKKMDVLSREYSHRLTSYFDIYADSRIKRTKDDMLLIASPWAVFSAVSQAYPKILMKIKPRSARTIIIPFPGTTLYGILAELVKNAICHAGSQVSMDVHWHICGEGFILFVSDNGEKIGKKLEHFFMPYDQFYEAANIKKSGGLAIISKLVALAGGSVLFSRSRALGGLMVRLQLPISCYMIRRRLATIGGTRYGNDK